MPHDDVDLGQGLERLPARRGQEPFLRVVQEEVGVETGPGRERECVSEFGFELVPRPKAVEADRDPMAPGVGPEGTDALGYDLEEPGRVRGAALPVVGRVGQDHGGPRAQGGQGVHESEAVQGRVSLDVLVRGHRQGRPRPIRDVVHDEVPHPREGPVRVDPEAEGMGEGFPHLDEGLTNRFRRGEFQAPLTPGREW